MLEPTGRPAATAEPPLPRRPPGPFVPVEDGPATATPVIGPFPLGAHVLADGVRFAVASSAARAIEVCLLDEIPGEPGTPGGGWAGRPARVTSWAERRIELTGRSHGVFHGFVPGVGPGQRYGFRVHGPWQPSRGVRCNPAKLLFDPYARALHGDLTGPLAAVDHVGDAITGTVSDTDSLGHVPLSVVTAPTPADPRPAKPMVPWSETVLYEAHVRGATRRHPDIPADLRGTYAALGHPAFVHHLTALGVTSLELLPVHAAADEPSLSARGRRNYWGYSTLGFFAPATRYAALDDDPLTSLRSAIDALHAAGVEVILDVVYNHTCEGGLGGPTVSWRGLDSAGYYVHDDGGGLRDITGCGNTLDAGSPTVIRMITDSLRYWATEVGVDGFRFDLASVLGRPGAGGFDPRSGLLTAIAVDPVLSACKLIAEPWDATGEGYRIGGFGVHWSEWNGRYRDTVRDYWRGATGGRDLAWRLAGSADLYGRSGRRPWSSINFITAHDGFTLRDLVTYNHKHNEANGEGNRDGTDDNRSWNHGVEGETPDRDIQELRGRQARNLLATLLLSTGTPMLLAGDELWRTQSGNNNAYCLDDQTSWMDWTARPPARQMRAFVARLLALRKATPALRQPEFFDGRDTPSGRPDVVWLASDGTELSGQRWFEGDVPTMGMWVDGADVRTGDGGEGRAPAGDSWLLIFHNGPEPDTFVLPQAEYGASYELVLDTARPDGVPDATTPVCPPASPVPLTARSVQVWRAPQ